MSAGNLENWIAGSARSYAASGVSEGERIVSTYNAGPFVAGAALAVRVELAPGADANSNTTNGLGRRDRPAPAGALVVQTKVELVPWGSLDRSQYKSKLVQ